MMKLALGGRMEEFLSGLVAVMIVVRACQIASGGGRSLHKSFGKGRKRASAQISKAPQDKMQDFLSFVCSSSFIPFD